MPKWLRPTHQFYITKLISVTLIQLLNNLKEGFQIKWPNDIYFGNEKVAGILIENGVQKNTIQNSIVGIGLNINQKEFKVKNATSLTNIIVEELALNNLLEEFCERLEANYLKLKRDFKVFDRLYLENLYRRGEVHSFENGNGKFEAEIIGVNEIGKLKLNVGSELKEFGLKELMFIL